MPASHQSLSLDRLILSDPSDGVVVGHPDQTELASAKFVEHRKVMRDEPRDGPAEICSSQPRCSTAMMNFAPSYLILI